MTEGNHSAIRVTQVKVDIKYQLASGAIGWVSTLSIEVLGQ
jgi:hypothetical protein